MNVDRSYLKKVKRIDMMDATEAFCNKNADTIFDIQYDSSLVLDVFEYVVLLSGIDRGKGV